MKDLIISATTKYGKEQLWNYVESIDKSGFEGDKIMVVYEIDKPTIDYLKSKGWQLYQFLLQGHIHMRRLIDMYSVLEKLDTEYRYVISTDVRDVVFQKNPSEYLEKNLKNGILVSSENVLYKDEPWGMKNIREGFGELPLSRYENERSCNVGVLAGEYKSIKDLLFLNYLISQSGNTKHFTDQSSFNFLIHSNLVKDNVQIEGFETKWAFQLGTRNHKGLIGYPSHELDEYYIVHQYDRWDIANEKINKKYK
jgi:hypothetical protein